MRSPPLRREQRAVAAERIEREIAGFSDRPGRHQAAGNFPFEVVLRHLSGRAVKHDGARNGGGRAAGPVVAGVQLQRLQHQPCHQPVEPFATGAFHHAGDHREIEIGVMEPAAARSMGGIPDAWISQPPAERFLQRHNVKLAPVDQARLVGEEVAQGDRPVRPGRVAQLPPQIVRNIPVKIECAFIDQAHHPQRGDELGNAGDPHRIVCRHGAGRGLVGKAFGQHRLDRLAIEGHRNRRRRGQRGSGCQG